MKRLLLFISICTLAISAFAGDINVKKAKEIAENFVPTSYSTRAATSTEMELVYTIESEVKPTHTNLYVFNKNNGGGFVIVSGEDQTTTEVLAYSTSGKFDANKLPDNAKAWLNEYSRQIDYLRSNGTNSAQKRRGTRGGAIVVAPLLGETTWGQGSPYNDLCPDKDPSGCVATAMGQIMYYHKWPQVGHGSHSYVWEGQTLTVNFNNSKYEWDKMLPYYTKSSSAESRSAVARLVYDIGVSVNMNYGSDGSGAVSADAVEAIKTYFDYNESAKYIEKTDELTNSGEWVKMLKTELNAKRPVFYSGQSSDGGHAFVCDGYDSQDYFHFNWGWDGDGNAFYALNAMTTNNLDFSSNNAVIIGIQANNSIEVNGMFFHLLGDNSVEFTYASDASKNYKGKVTIPSTITYNGKTYTVTQISSQAFGGCTELTDVVIPSTVTRIGNGAFANCPSLKTITVSWNTPVIVDASILDNDTYSHTSLIIPDGTLAAYSITTPWCFFVKIQDSKGNKEEYGQWEPFGAGTGTYTYAAYFSGDDPEPIFCRTTSVPDLYQMRIDNLFYGVSMFFFYNKATGECQVPPFYTGYNDPTYGKLYQSDIPNYGIVTDNDPDEYTYTEFPCVFDDAMGIFTFTLIAYVDEGYYGVAEETFKMDGYKDYTISLRASTLTEKSDKSASQLINVTMGDGVTNFKYVLLPENITYGRAKEIAQEIADGTRESKTSTASKVIAALPGPGNYAVVAASFENDQYRMFDYANIKYYSSKDWESVGKAHATDDVLTFYEMFDPVTYDVDIEINKNIYGLFRVKNLFGAPHPYSSKSYFAYDKKDVYIIIDATDPEAVHIDYQDMGVNIDESGRAYIYSLGKYYLDNGIYSLSDIKKYKYCGTYKDKKIEFPYRSILIDAYNDGNLYYTNYDSKFKLDLSDVKESALWSSIQSVVSEQTTVEGIYSINGSKMQDLKQGINIIKMSDGNVKKVFIK